MPSFAAALSAVANTARILEGDVDPETAYYDIYRATFGELTDNGSNEVVEATMKIYFPFEYDDGRLVGGVVQRLYVRSHRPARHGGDCGMTAEHMSARAAMVRIVDTSGMSRRQLSVSMGRYPQYLNQKVNDKQTPKADTLAEVARVCGYELLLRGHDTEIIIDPPDKEDE